MIRTARFFLKTFFLPFKWRAKELKQDYYYEPLSPDFLRSLRSAFDEERIRSKKEGSNDSANIFIGKIELIDYLLSYAEHERTKDIR